MTLSTKRRLVHHMMALCCVVSLLTLRALAQSYQQIDVPGAVFTVANGINNKYQIVGYFGDPTGVVHGFMLTNGHYVTLDFPRPHFTVARAINSSGFVVGFYNDRRTSHGFLAELGGFAKLDFPGSTSSMASGINQAGDIVGTYTDANGNAHGFKFSNNSWTTIDVPNATSTVASGIDRSGNIVGTFTDGVGNHGFLRRPNGQLHTLDYPGTQGVTTAEAINIQGQVVGTFINPSVNKVQGYEFTNNQFVPILYPGRDVTFVYGINDTDFAVGAWPDDLDTDHGFLRTP